MTTESPRRTQITVVERIRRPSARSSGWARPIDVLEADFTMAGDFAERGEEGFMGNLQYIAKGLCAYFVRTCTSRAETPVTQTVPLPCLIVRHGLCFLAEVLCFRRFQFICHSLFAPPASLLRLALAP